VHMKIKAVAFDVSCEALELAWFIAIMSSPLLYLCHNCFFVCVCVCVRIRQPFMWLANTLTSQPAFVL